MSSMLGIGITGLIAYQRSLRTVSHNVANAQTEGYSRQRVELGTQSPLFLGGQYVGTGVRVANIERVHDSFLTRQTQIYTASFNSAETMARYAGIVDEVLADPSVGLGPALDDFFGAAQDVSNDPTSLPARQAFLTQSENLAERYNYLDQRFEEVRSQLNRQLRAEVADVNSLTSSIAMVNRNLFLAGGSAEANDLLDERDRLLGRLAEKIGITTLEQDDGSVNVFTGNGQQLVVGFEPYTLTAVPNRFDTSEFEIGTGANGQFVFSDFIKGGVIGGLLEFRRDILNEAQNSVGVSAIALADRLNQQHRLGQDIIGNLGTDLFNVPEVEIRPELGVSNVVTATLADSGNLVGDEYLLRNVDGAGSFELIRQSDRQVFNINTGGGVYTHTEIDGFQLNFTAAGNAGDEYIVRPGRSGAQFIRAQISDPREVAAALPVRDAKGIGNTGNAVLDDLRVTSAANLPLPGNVTLSYVAGSSEFTVVGAVPPVPNIPYVDGGTIAFNGLEFVVRGVPANGDTFELSNNTAGVGDNRNMLQLIAMQSQSTMAGGTASFQEYYGQIVAEVGIKTRQSQLVEDAQRSLMDQALNEQQALSGVNLDEEAANLLKFQQAYQAAAQVISAADEMFQTLLNVVGR